MSKGKSFSSWLKPRLRLYAIYCELGYIPWRRPRKKRERKAGKGHDSVYMGTKEALIPFLNDDAKRTFSHLLFRPGYMMRDYIRRGQHERYLAPLTALLVFYSVFTLLLAVFNPSAAKKSVGDELLSSLKDVHMEMSRDSISVSPRTARIADGIIKSSRYALLLPRLDLHPEEVDTPWKESLAALESDIRGKGIPLFLGGFLFLWLSMAILLRRYDVSFSGAAAASAFVMCQSCVFMLLALLLTWGRSSGLGLLFSAILLFIDYRQFLQTSYKKTFWLTVKTGIWIVLFRILFYMLLAGAVVVVALIYS